MNARDPLSFFASHSSRSGISETKMQQYMLPYIKVIILPETQGQVVGLYQRHIRAKVLIPRSCSCWCKKRPGA